MGSKNLPLRMKKNEAMRNDRVKARHMQENWWAEMNMSHLHIQPSKKNAAFLGIPPELINQHFFNTEIRSKNLLSFWNDDMARNCKIKKIKNNSVLKKEINNRTPHGPRSLRYISETEPRPCGVRH